MQNWLLSMNLYKLNPKPNLLFLLCPLQKNHLAQASFQVKAFDQTFILDLELNQ